ncbi:MAG: S-layer homology domain-containing protein [Clostridiales Family XIII bacterium]|jgi:acetyl esterase/lipase|nr:S-layer homology domain-containing protein [Clostridiales Family XIII bacterium]
MKNHQRIRRLLTVVLTLALCVPAAATVSAVQYPDTAGRPDTERIDAWSDAGVLRGASQEPMGPEFFRPDAPATRADAAESLYAIFRDAWTERTEKTFSDLYGLPDAKVSYAGVNAILHAVAADVLHGSETPMGRTISPLNPVTREELAVMIARAFKIEAPAEDADFKDAASVSRYATGAVSAFVSKGYLPVGEDGAFNPDGTVTRSELLAVYERMTKDYPSLAARKTESGSYAYTEILVGKSPIADAAFSQWENIAAFTPAHALEPFTYAENREKDISVRFYKPIRSTGHDPLLLYVFGGAWVLGDNTQIEAQNFALLETCLRNGIAVASLSYSLSQEAAYPQPLHELKAQIRYLRANAESLGIDPDNFGIAGASAGGYWAQLLALTGDSPAHEGELFGNAGVSSKVGYALDMFGISDMTNMFGQVDPYIQDIDTARFMHDTPFSAEAMFFGMNRYKSEQYPAGVSMADIRAVRASGDVSHELWELAQTVKSASPVNNVDSGDPPFLLYHGTQDFLVPVYQDIELYALLKKANVPAQIHIAAYTGHELLHPAHEIAIYDWVVAQAKP